MVKLENLLRMMKVYSTLLLYDESISSQAAIS